MPATRASSWSRPTSSWCWPTRATPSRPRSSAPTPASSASTATSMSAGRRSSRRRRDVRRRLAIEAGFVSHADVAEDGPGDAERGVRAGRGVDRKLAPGQGAVGDRTRRRRRARSRTRRWSGCCRRSRPGVTEAELALQLEWDMRTHGAEALAFDVACLSGPRAALPHGSPGRARYAAARCCCSTSGRRSTAIARTRRGRCSWASRPRRPRDLPHRRRRPAVGHRRAWHTRLPRATGPTAARSTRSPVM